MMKIAHSRPSRRPLGRWLCAGMLAAVWLCGCAPAGEEPPRAQPPSTAQAKEQPQPTTGEPEEDQQPAPRAWEFNWGEPVNGLAIGVATERTAFCQGEPVVVVASIRNVSGNRIQFVETRPDYSTSVVVRNARGHAVPHTRYGRWVEGIEGAREVIGTHIIVLEPGEETEGVLHVNRCVDMTLSGKHTIVVGKMIRPGRQPHQHEFTLESPPIEVSMEHENSTAVTAQWMNVRIHSGEGTESTEVASLIGGECRSMAKLLAEVWTNSPAEVKEQCHKEFLALKAVLDRHESDVAGLPGPATAGGRVLALYTKEKEIRAALEALEEAALKDEAEDVRQQARVTLHAVCGLALQMDREVPQPER